ncbi:hypothetical protein [Methanorbis furvi]|uniref:Uncharacterized protein n=1 Tax=Methanorbis furvi TaxID=3028299 RepID=A0AAE4SCF2_9EURY|nr:hypothetical protein [Methanocorpusculaceae archaeon Ag1]
MIRPASDDGVTEIIGFVLIMGLVVIVLFIMALTIPPMNGAELENELALGAVQDISNLKYDMDLLWEDARLKNVTRSVLIQLSTPKEGMISMLPAFKPTIGSATLTAGVSDLNITIGEDNTTYDNFLRLTYATSNHYTENSVVMYDAGAVFTGTQTYQSMLLAPSVGKGSDGTLFIVLPRQTLGETSVLGNSFGVVNYTVGVQSTKEFSGSIGSPVMIKVSSSNEQVRKAWENVLRNFDPQGSDGEFKYDGKVKVLSVDYAMKVQGAVPWQ